MDYKLEYNDWLNNDFFDKDTRRELEEIKDNEEEIKDRFYKNLEFGTAGLRGIMGSGTNRMNKYTVMKATQGLANFIKKENGEKRGVVIAYDSRNNSREFADIAALCLNANGIKSYVFEEETSTPELSFSVRELNCISGIVITASHNPPKYNGYKVYWEDGAQITYPKDVEIIEEVNNMVDYYGVKSIKKEEAIRKGLYNVIGKEMDDRYIEEIKKNLINIEAIKQQGKNVTIVYTPLHGTGARLVKRVLGELGFEKLFIVPEQEKPDGNFPTVDYPNPEDEKSFKMALNLAKEKNSDVVIATDPDADRIGIFVKNKDEYIRFNGNMIGVFLAEYLLSQKKEKGILPKNGALIKTVVSTNMLEQIAKEYGVEIKEVLTGFKYIGEQIKIFEKTKSNEFIFGFEESFGCLVGTHSRDKDGIVSTMMFAEMVAYYKQRGMGLWDQMLKMYEKYGYFEEESFSIVLPGIDGSEKMKNMMSTLRNLKLEKIGNYKVTRIKDFNLRKSIDMNTMDESIIKLPKSNVLYYELQDEAWCCVRPSGTEPKIKFYMGIRGSNFEESKNKIEKIKQDFKEIIDSL
ncbi:MAG: phospho-sugar mutase [Clostridia bacterium]|nr:phospho-sugar mutase [Clostridia bacterium]